MKRERQKKRKGQSFYLRHQNGFNIANKNASQQKLNN